MNHTPRTKQKNKKKGKGKKTKRDEVWLKAAPSSRISSLSAPRVPSRTVRKSWTITSDDERQRRVSRRVGTSSQRPSRFSSRRDENLDGLWEEVPTRRDTLRCRSSSDVMVHDFRTVREGTLGADREEIREEGAALSQTSSRFVFLPLPFFLFFCFVRGV